MTTRRRLTPSSELPAEALERAQAAERRNRARARKAGRLAEFVDVGALFTDQNGDCGCNEGCGKPLNPAALWPEPDAITIGHSNPISCGGGHTRENVQLERLECNLKDGREKATPTAAHIVRLQKKSRGERGRALKGRGFPGHRKFDGTPVFKERKR